MREFRLPLDTGAATIPGVGICEPRETGGQMLEVECRSALRPPGRMRVHADYPGWDLPMPPLGRVNETVTGQINDSPFPAQVLLSPVQAQAVFFLGGKALEAALRYPATQFVFEIEEPAAHYETEFEFPNVRLADYAVAVPER